MKVSDKYKCYSSWCSMKTRCLNKNRKEWKNYGGRGIKICVEWMLFSNFLRDMGDRPDGYSIDRKDPNGNYNKENCRWIKISDQGKTTRKYLSIGLCSICKEVRARRKGRCHKCSEFFHRTGIERPNVFNVMTHRAELARIGNCARCKRDIFWCKKNPVKGFCDSCYRSQWQIENKL